MRGLTPLAAGRRLANIVRQHRVAIRPQGAVVGNLCRLGSARSLPAPLVVDDGNRESLLRVFFSLARLLLLFDLALRVCVEFGRRISCGCCNAVKLSRTMGNCDWRSRWRDEFPPHQ